MNIRDGVTGDHLREHPPFQRHQKHLAWALCQEEKWAEEEQFFTEYTCVCFTPQVMWTLVNRNITFILDLKSKVIMKRLASRGWRAVSVV